MLHYEQVSCDGFDGSCRTLPTKICAKDDVWVYKIKTKHVRFVVNPFPFIPTMTATGPYLGTVALRGTTFSDYATNTTFQGLKLLVDNRVSGVQESLTGSFTSPGYHVVTYHMEPSRHGTQVVIFGHLALPTNPIDEEVKVQLEYGDASELFWVASGNERTINLTTAAPEISFCMRFETAAPFARVVLLRPSSNVNTSLNYRFNFILQHGPRMLL